MHIGHVALQVPDLRASAQYAVTALGLSVTEESSEEVLLTANNKHHELQLIAATSAALDHVGLEVGSESELESVVGSAVSAGGELVDSPPHEKGIGRSVRVVGPGDIVYELYAGMDRLPPTGNAFLEAGLRRLGHLTFFAESHAEILEFWLDGLGFKFSDHADGITWTRCDADHHGLAVGPRPSGNVLHHHAWEVQDLSAIGQYCDSLATEGLRLMWGPVRHGPGYNLATYLPDLDGGMIEVYSDLLRITDDTTYTPVDWDSVPDALNLWGPAPPPELLEAGIPTAARPAVSASATAAKGEVA